MMINDSGRNREKELAATLTAAVIMKMKLSLRPSRTPLPYTLQPTLLVAASTLLGKQLVLKPLRGRKQYAVPFIGMLIELRWACSLIDVIRPSKLRGMPRSQHSLWWLLPALCRVMHTAFTLVCMQAYVVVSGNLIPQVVYYLCLIFEQNCTKCKDMVLNSISRELTTGILMAVDW